MPAFVDRMNQRALEMGLSNTHFDTPSGLDGETHYSSARDMALLAAEALENPDFAADLRPGEHEGGNWASS